MQIPQAFPTLWRMLMSRIQHLRTRLPVHIDLVHGHGPKKPGQWWDNREGSPPRTTKVCNIYPMSVWNTEIYRNLNVQSVPSAALIEGPRHSDVLFWNVCMDLLWKAWSSKRSCNKNRETTLCSNLPVSTLCFEKFQVYQRFEYPHSNLQEQRSSCHMSSHMSTTKMTSIFPSSTPKFALWNLSIIGLKATWNIFDFSPRSNIQAATFKPWQPRFLTVLTSWVLNR